MSRRANESGMRADLLFLKDRIKRKNLADADKKNQMDKVDLYLFSVMTLEDQARSSEDLMVIVNFIMNIQSIQQVRHLISDDSFKYLARCSRLLQYKELEIVCKYGEPSTRVYYVLEGSVAITGMNASKYTHDLLRDNLLSVIDKNRIFGEAGVMAHSFRTANCVCLVPTKLLVFEARAYRDSIGKAVSSIKDGQVGLLRKVKLLETWETHKISAFYEGLVTCRRVFSFDNILYNAGTHLNKIIIIVSGQVEISTFDNKTGGGGSNVPLLKINERKRIRKLLILGDGGWLGDENNPVYDGGPIYSARVVSSQCVSYVMGRQTLFDNAIYGDRTRISNLLKDRVKILREIHRNKDHGKRSNISRIRMENFENLKEKVQFEIDETEDKIKGNESKRSTMENSYANMFNRSSIEGMRLTLNKLNQRSASKDILELIETSPQKKSLVKRREDMSESKKSFDFTSICRKRLLSVRGNESDRYKSTSSIIKISDPNSSPLIHKNRKSSVHMFDRSRKVTLHGIPHSRQFSLRSHLRPSNSHSSRIIMKIDTTTSHSPNRSNPSNLLPTQITTMDNVETSYKQAQTLRVHDSTITLDNHL